jgi:hypothetical protein
MIFIQSLPSNRLIWIDDLPFPEDSRLVLALPINNEDILQPAVLKHFQPLGLIAKNLLSKPNDGSTTYSILHYYNFPPLSVPGGFLNPTNAHLIIVKTDNLQSTAAADGGGVDKHFLLLGLLSNSHPLITSLAPSQLEISLPLPAVGCWSPIDQQNLDSTDD